MIGRADIEGSKSNPVIPVVTFLTPLASNSEVRLESSSTGSSFPLILPSPFPWLWFRWIVDRDIGFPLSVPVLSWLFDARGKLPKEPFPVRPPADTRRSALATLAAQAAHQQLTEAVHLGDLMRL
ncbi:unnamed protein product [Brassica napus]|uniref:(rape) hypothetical protein n=1 Tax=Brassica napus TaxID=3708 RepID=A0A816SR20_BRANA|nr:unnamed protein product [Brassica napus]